MYSFNISKNIKINKITNSIKVLPLYQNSNVNNNIAKYYQFN